MTAVLQTALLALTLLLAASDVEGRVAAAIAWFEDEVEQEDVLLGGYEEQAIRVRDEGREEGRRDLINYYCVQTTKAKSVEVEIMDLLNLFSAPQDLFICFIYYVTSHSHIVVESLVKL